MKELTITISGTAGSGKTLMQCLLINALRDVGIKNVEFVPDLDFGTEDELHEYVENIFDEVASSEEFLEQFHTKVQTQQTRKELNFNLSAREVRKIAESTIEAGNDEQYNAIKTVIIRAAKLGETSTYWYASIKPKVKALLIEQGFIIRHEKSFRDEYSIQISW